MIAMDRPVVTAIDSPIVMPAAIISLFLFHHSSLNLRMERKIFDNIAPISIVTDAGVIWDAPLAKATKDIGECIRSKAKYRTVPIMKNIRSQ